MVNLTALDWLFGKELPLSGEVSILKVDCGRSNKIVSKDVIIVVSINHKWRTTGERSLKFEHLVELWIGVIKLIIVSFIFDFVIASNVKVRITMTSIISGHEIDTLDHI